MNLQLASAALLLLLCAGFLRWYAGAGLISRPLWVTGLDFAPMLLGALFVTVLTARPLLGAVFVASLTGGLAGADYVKRQVLREPVVFSDRAELLEVVRHPEFYLPFAGTATVLAAAAGAVAVIAGLAWIVPPAWPWSPWSLGSALVVLGIIMAAWTLPGWPPVLQRLRRIYERLQPHYDPAQDMPRWGILACFIIHATLARAERPERRRAAAAVLRAPRVRRGGPVVVAQLESFFDARRLHPAIPRDLLPGFDACRAQADSTGVLQVPTWGANTIRTEFAALTGLDGQALGLDRFNAYERFARARLDALPWRMQALGYQTICLHPFDKRFYGRHHAIPALGFERFIGPEAFPRAVRDGFVTDDMLARKAAEILAEAGPNLFLFVISVGNHGPWLADRGPEDALPLPAPLQALPAAAALRRYLGGLRRTDSFFPVMTEALHGTSGQGLLLAYGDHQPSLPALFTALGHHDADTDYVLWESGSLSRNPGRPQPRCVESLPQLLLDRISVRATQDAA